MAWIDDLKYQYNKGDSAVRRLVFINVAVFLLIMLARVIARLWKVDAEVFDHILQYLYLPAGFSELMYKPWSLITYMFLHAGFFHILGNMIMLWVVGNIIEGFLGKNKVYQIYLLSGLLGGVLHIIMYTFFPALAETQHLVNTLGASGAVMGIMVATITLLPEYQIRLMLIGVIKLRWIVIGLLVLNILSLGGPGNTSYTVHIGGALIGFLYIRYIQGRLGFTLPKIKNPFKRSKLKVERNKTRVNTYVKHNANQDEVDAILDKISRSGYGSLTQQEKDVLFRASQKED